MERRKNILMTIDDLVSDFLGDDREDDDDLPIDAIEEAVEQGEITVAEMVAEFERRLRDGLGEPASTEDPCST